MKPPRIRRSLDREFIIYAGDRRRNKTRFQRGMKSGSTLFKHACKTTLRRTALLRPTLREPAPGRRLFNRTTLHCIRLRTCAMNCGRNNSCQPLERKRIVGTEGIGLGREYFQKSDDCLVPANRNCDNRTNAEHSTALPIHERIGLGIVTAQQLPGADALAGKPRANAEPRPWPRNVVAGARAANHARAFRQSDCCTGCARESLCSLRQQSQRSIKVRAQPIYFSLDCGQCRQDRSIVSRRHRLDFLPHPVEQRAVFRLLLWESWRSGGG